MGMKSAGSGASAVGKKLVGSVDMENGTLQKYAPGKLDEKAKTPAAARQAGGSHLGNTTGNDYNAKSKGNFEGMRGEKLTDKDTNAGGGITKVNVKGLIGNTKNVARDPGPGGHNTTEGFGGKVGDALLGARRGGGGIVNRPGPDTAKGVGVANEGGILGNTRDVRRDPKGKNVTEGFAGGGTVGNGFV